MYENIIEEVKGEASRAATLQRQAIDAFQKLESDDGSHFDIATTVEDRSISDLDTQTSTLVKFAEGFRTDKNWAFVPRNWIVDFREALKNTANSYENLAKNIAAVDAEHGGTAKIDAAALSVETKSGTHIELRKIFGNIAANVDNGFAAYFRMRPAISAPRLSEFTDLLSFFTSRRSELDSLSRELSSLEKEGSISADAIRTALDAATKDQDEIKRLKSDATKQQTEIKDAAEKVGNDVEKIEKTRNLADELATAVASYQSQFDQFKKELDTRNADHTSKKAAFEKLKANLDVEAKRIEQISHQADDMLRGATNAGLAGSYSQKQQAVEREITKARYAYYFSISLLVFLTLPIFIYSFPREVVAEIFKQIFGVDAPSILLKDNAVSDYQLILNFVGRAVFLIPGLMFVRFASRRHEMLFRLREEYTYKYSIAASVDGFMKQAKTYADDIAAASYYELTYNPTERMDGNSEDARMINPIFEKMLSRLESRMVKLKKKRAPDIEESKDAGTT